MVNEKEKQALLVQRNFTKGESDVQAGARATPTAEATASQR
jgi:hypothetical protein